MKNLLSISEFSKFSGITISTLRQWDELGLFPPLKHDVETNYRYYAPEQIINAKFIVLMRSLGVPLKTIGEIHNSRNAEKVIRLLEKQRRVLDQEMHRLRECYSIIDTRLELLYNGMHLEEGFHAIDGHKVDKKGAKEGSTWIDERSVGILYHDEQVYIRGPECEWAEGKTSHDLFAEFCINAESLRINLNYSVGSYHESMTDFMKDPIKHKHFISLDPVGNFRRPAGKYLTAFCRGGEKGLRDVASRMEAYAKEHELRTQGGVYRIYLHDELCVDKGSDFLIQISVAVTDKRK